MDYKLTSHAWQQWQFLVFISDLLYFRIEHFLYHDMIIFLLVYWDAKNFQYVEARSCSQCQKSFRAEE